MRPIDADELKAMMVETLEQIKANPKMDGQEMHIIAGIAMLGEMIDGSPTIDAALYCGVSRKTLLKWAKEEEQDNE